MYCTYVLISQKTGHLYIGSTSDFSARLRQHQSGEARYTRGRGPWEVLLVEEFHNRADAMRRERELKAGRGRAWLRAQLNGTSGPPQAD